jgi:hypothetical protein
MQKINITTKIDVKQSMGWPQDVPVTIRPKHYNLNDRVWLVYIRDNLSTYDYFVGEVTIAGVRQEKRMAGTNGILWRYEYWYMVTHKNGKELLGKWWESEVREYQVFASKALALGHLREAALAKLDDDRKHKAKYLAIVDDTIQKVKDTTIELKYGSIG